jgi:predicted O-linked N-acetylglucosamine transferase (SPINDLY family)
MTSGTGTLLSLWANLPLLTRHGSTPQSRMASALLLSAQLPDCVTRTRKEYIDTAIAYYHDTEKLKHLRKTIEQNKHQFSIFSPQTFITQLERGYQHMFHNTQQGIKHDIHL